MTQYSQIVILVLHSINRAVAVVGMRCFCLVAVIPVAAAAVVVVVLVLAWHLPLSMLTRFPGKHQPVSLFQDRFWACQWRASVLAGSIGWLQWKGIWLGRSRLHLLVGRGLSLSWKSWNLREPNAVPEWICSLSPVGCCRYNIYIYILHYIIIIKIYIHYCNLANALYIYIV